jgi:hypothetical protein
MDAKMVAYLVAWKVALKADWMVEMKVVQMVEHLVDWKVGLWDGQKVVQMVAMMAASKAELWAEHLVE